VVTSAPLRCHLLWTSGDRWDLEQSVFSLVGQQDVSLRVAVHAPPERTEAARECLQRLAPLAPSIPLVLAPLAAPLDSDASAVAVWNAGTVATPDHFSRCWAALEAGAGTAAVVAPVRRMTVRRQPDGPPFVVAKRWRWTARFPSLAEVTADPSFVGRCLVRSAAVAGPLPADLEAQQLWAGRLWARTRPRRVDGPPTIDLLDLRERDEPTSWRDTAADLRYQLPRRFERMAPLAFQRARRIFHLLRTEVARRESAPRG